ncbi:MAG: Queuine tRNA-ribosyltransferase [Candidatus Pacebacteria bacterium GW2011_GWA1_46_10]|nr:MAG: Queuine tRNA-ribosyltransferase [Candidatus Pacebacteria bacterium GW2011_GWA1_46_10]HCR81291.1 hypothetical protein [Candidatus Paceibacterota bacterium]
MKQLNVGDHRYTLPLFLPDATRGVVRGLSSQQVQEVGIQGVVVNTYHLLERPGTVVLKKLGSVGALMSWRGLIVSDSGGFQLFSLIHKHPKLGKITDEGVVLYSSEKQRRKTLFTPEDSIKTQFAIGADIMICLDDFSPVSGSAKRLQESVERTTAWAKRCKTEFEKQCRKKGLSKRNRPLLFAVIQGHDQPALRQQSAQELIELGFDGFGFGGWPLDSNGDFDYHIARVIADATPNDKPRFALGVGSPANIVKLRLMGYDLFDCVLPTRDARHQRLYVLNQPLNQVNFSGKRPWYQHLYIDRGRYVADPTPVDQYCDCPTCKNYSKAYLHHLFKIQDSLAFQLAITHNLWFYAQLMKKLQQM